MLNKKALAGTAGAPKEYVEDVFSTYLYTGANSVDQTITNGIDLSSKGGMVWIKNRGSAVSHCITSTEQGIINDLATDTTSGISGRYESVKSVTTSGFVLEAGKANANSNANTYASWTFRKAKKFFDVVTYTGNGSAPRNISHNLDSSPGFIAIKRTDSTGDWWCWHRSIANKNIYLNYTDAADSGANPMISAVSSTNFTLATNQNATMNINGATYVAYLFAHDAGGFGDAGSDSIIKCGSSTGGGSAGDVTVNLGWEPQFVILKRTDSSTAGDWEIIDNMRGYPASSDGENYLLANSSAAEGTGGYWTGSPNATGFTHYAYAGATYIYIAIRRGPMKTPTDATKVFHPQARSGDFTQTALTAAGFPPDTFIYNARNSTLGKFFSDRLRGVDNGGGARLNSTSDTTEQTSYSDVLKSFNQNGVTIGADGSGFGGINDANYNYIYYYLRRAPGFFDVVCYTGGNSTNTRVTHNLGVAPELIIVKPRSATGSWGVYVSSEGRSKYMLLNNTIASTSFSDAWGASNPTTTDFGINDSGSGFGYGTATMVAYLFASVSGVSKVGSFTGNGSSVTVTTDFQPRFILVKRTDSTGDWLVSDSARGLVAGNDPYLRLNSTAAEVTNEDWVDISSTSFTVNQTTNNANVNTGTYIYLCIA